MNKNPNMEFIDDMSDEELIALNKRQYQLRIARNLAIFIGVKIATMILLRRMAKRLS